jgi:RHS repeat-associated protein
MLSFSAPHGKHRRSRQSRRFSKNLERLKGRRLRFEALEVRQLLTINPCVIDNQSPQYHESGTNWASWNDTNAYQGDFRYHAAGDGTDTASWTFSGLTAGEDFQLFATWTADSNRATNAPFTVLDGNTPLATVQMNEQFAPSEQTLDNHAWQSIGTYHTDTGSLTVQLADNANGYVIADAVCAVEVPAVTTAPSTVDNGDAAYAEQGSGWLGWSESGAYQGDFRYHAPGAGQDTATWTFQDLDPNATYQVYATWSAQSNRATDAPYTILDNTTSLGTVRLNQQFAPDNATFNGQSWQSLGAYQFSSGTLTVSLSDDVTSGYVVADAIHIVEVPPVTAAPAVVDNADAAYAEQGDGWLGWSESGAYQGDFRYHAPGNSQDAATWTFAALDPAKQYEVYATWSAQSNRTTDAPYTILDGTTSLGTVRLNQQIAPDSTTYDGQSWESLGTYQFSSGKLTVSLSDDVGSGYVVADAIHIVEVPQATGAPGVVDNADAAYTETGTGWDSRTGADDYLGDSRRHAAGSGDSAADWQFADLPAGNYTVYATWGAAADQATNAPYTIYDGSSEIGTERVNQQVTPASEAADGAAWQIVGTYWIGSGRMRVELTDNANGTVVADAIRIVDPYSLYWDPNQTCSESGGGSGTWDSSDSFWYDPISTSDVPWNNDGDHVAVFGGETAGPVTISNTMTIAAIQFETSGYVIQTGQGGGSLQLAGTLPSIEVDGGTATIASQIGGSGGLTKTGPGTLVLSNNSNNSNNYSGGTSVQNGTLAIGANNGLPTGGTVTLGYGSLGGVLQLGDGTTSYNQTLASLTTSGSGQNWVVGGGSSTAVLIVNVSGSDSFNGILGGYWGQDNLALTKLGTGTLTLSGANTYTGTTTVSAGILDVQSPYALGTADAGTTVSGGATLQLDGGGTGIDISGEALTLNGAGVSSGGALRSISGTNTYGGLITLGSSATIDCENGSTLNIANTGTITGSGNGLTVSGSGGTSISSVIGIGSGSLTKNGAGTLTLSGNNTFTGNTIMTDSSGCVMLDSPLALQFSTLAVTINSPYHGQGYSPLGFAGSMTTATLGGLSGGLGISGGSGSGELLILNNAAGGAVNLLVGNNSNTDTSYLGSVSGSGGITKVGSGTLTLNYYVSGGGSSGGASSGGSGGNSGGNSGGSGGNSGGSGGSGGSAHGNYTYSGGTTLQGGTLVFYGSTFGSGPITFAGGTLRWASGGWSSGGADITSGGRSVSVNAGTSALLDTNGNNVTFSGGITGSGGLIKSGGGTLTLSAVNGFTGDTQVTGGTLKLGVTNALQGSTLDYSYTGTFDFGTLTSATMGGLTGSNSLSLRNSATPQQPVALTIGQDDASTTYSGVLSGSGSLIKAGTGTLTLTGNNTYTGSTTVSGGALQIGDGSTSGGAVASNIVDNAALTFDNAAGATWSYSGVLSGSGVLTKSGGGTLTLNAANPNFTGETQITGGRLILGNPNALQSSTLDYSYSGTLDFGNQTSATLGGLQGSEDLALLNSAVSPQPVSLTVGQDNASTVYSGILSGSGSLFEVGTGTLTLSGDNTYSGGTTVNGDVLQAGNENALGTGPLTVAAGETFDLNGYDVTVGSIGGSGTITDLCDQSAVTLTVVVASGTTTFAGQILDGSGSVALVEDGAGVLQLTNSNAYTGGTTVENGTLQLGDGTANNGSVLNDIVVDAGAVIAFFNPTAQSYDGSISGDGSFVKSGGGALTLTGASTYTGTTSIENGTLVVSGDGDCLPTGTTVILGSGGSSGVLQLGDGGGSCDQTLAGLVVSGGTGNRVVGGATTDSTLTLDIDGTDTFAGILGGTGTNQNELSLAMTGQGVLVLTGSNTYGGGTTVGDGTLQIGDGTSGGGGSIAGDITDDSSLVFDRCDTLVFDHTVTGTGSLTQSGSGTLLLGSAANDYWGDTIVAAGGTLKVGSNGAIPSGYGRGDVILDGTLDLNGQSVTINGLFGSGSGTVTSSASGGATLIVGADGQTSTFSGLIEDGTGQVGLTKIGEGTLTLNRLGTDTRANAYSGDTTVSEGVLNVQFGSALGTATAQVVVDDGATLQLQGLQGGITIANPLLISDAGTNGALEEGVLESVSGSNTYSGLIALGDDAQILCDSSSSLTNSGTISGNGFALTVGGDGNVLITSCIGTGAGTLTKDDNGILTLTGTNTYTGDTSIEGGTLQIGDGGTAGSMAGDISIASGTSLLLNRCDYLNVNGDISGAGSLAQIGSGVSVLWGANSYSGATTVSQGTLEAANVGALSTSSDLTVSGGATVAVAADHWAPAAVDSLLTRLSGASGNLGFDVAEGDSFAYATPIGGSIGLTKLGGGTLLLGGNGSSGNTYSGATLVNEGVLEAVQPNALPTSSQLTVASGATIAVPVPTSAWTSSAIGSLLGRLSASSGGGSLGFDVADGESASYSTPITGSIGLTKLGGGTLVLTGDSTSSGAIAIEAGTLQVGDGTSGGSGSVAGNIIDDAALVFDRAATLTYSGNISGTGSVTQSGGGTLILSGASTFTGDTTIADGYVALDSSTALQASVVNCNTDGALSFDSSLTSATLGGLAGSGGITLPTLTSGCFALTVAVADGVTATYSGILSGGGRLIKAGAGELLLGGANNTYSGGTTVSSGILEAAYPSSVPTSGLTVAPQATLAVTASYSYYSYSNWLPADIDSLQSLMSGSSGNLGIDVASSQYPYPSDMTTASGGTCSWGLVKLGSGTLELTGSTIKPSGTTISAGTLQIGDGTSEDGSISGSIVDNATLTFDVADEGEYCGGLSGAGTLIKSGGGTLTLTGSNPSFTGTTEIEQGLLLLGNSTVLQSSTLNYSYSGWYSSAEIDFGNLTAVTLGGLEGTSDLPLLNDNSSAVTLTVNNSTAAYTTYSGNLSDGSLVIGSGPGTLVLAGSADSLPDNITINSGGTLEIDTSVDTPSSSISDNGSLIFSSDSASQTYSGTLSGSGSVTKNGGDSNGNGALILDGSDTYTGPTYVNAGIVVAGSLSSSKVVVGGSAELISSGSSATFAGDLAVAGTFSPGGDDTSTSTSLGYDATAVVHVHSLLFASGSTYSVQLNGDNDTATETDYDQIQVDGTGGAIDLDGASLSLSGDRTPNNGAVIVLIKNNGNAPVQGTFCKPETTQHYLEGDHVSGYDGTDYQITYHYNAATGQFGTGNDVALVDVTGGSGGWTPGPSIASGGDASATLDPGDMDTTAKLTALGADLYGGESNLTYTWSIVQTPAGAPEPTFATNGTNAAKQDEVVFGESGSYQFCVTIADAYGREKESYVTVPVAQIAGSISIAPTTTMLDVGQSQQFSATCLDQFGDSMATPANLQWRVTAGQIDNQGNYLAPARSASDIVTVTSPDSGAVGSAAVIVLDEGPTVVSGDEAAATAVVDNETTTTLTVQGAGEAGLTYTWQATPMSPDATGDVDFSDNGTTTANTTTATFHSTGTYEFTVTIADPDGMSTTSTVDVTVDPIVSSIVITPAVPSLAVNDVDQFTAVAVDQFGNDLVDQPQFQWSASDGQIDSSSGFYIAPSYSTTKSVTITATATVSNSTYSQPTTIPVSDNPPTVAAPAMCSDATVTGTTTTLSVLGADDGGESNLTYTWGVTTYDGNTVTDGNNAGVEFSLNGTNDAKCTDVTFPQAGTYVFVATITDEAGQSTTSSVAVTVAQTTTSITVTPDSPTMDTGGQQEIDASVVDQFNDPMSASLVWSSTGGTIQSTGADTASHTASKTPVAETIYAEADGVIGSCTITVTAASDFSPATALRSGDNSTGSMWKELLGNTIDNTNLYDEITAPPSATMLGYTFDTSYSASPADLPAFSPPTSTQNVACTTTADTPSSYSITVDGSSDPYSATQTGSVSDSANYTYVASTGNWSYHEWWYYSYSVVTPTPLVCSSGYYSYELTASGNYNTGYSHYTCTFTSFATAFGISSTVLPYGTSSYVWRQATGNTDTITSTAHGGLTDYWDCSGGGASFSLVTLGFYPYQYPIDGGTVSGFEHFNNSQFCAYGYDRTWTNSGGWSGSCWNSASGNGHDDYSDSGSYSTSSATLTSSGSVSHSGRDDYSYNSQVSYSLNSNGLNWMQSSGTAAGSASGEAHSSLSGSGTYSNSYGSASTGNYWSMSGTFNQNGHDDSTYSGSYSASAGSGAWTWSGSDTVTASGSSHYDYSGSGNYSSSGAGWSSSGSLSQSGRTDSSYSSTANYSLDAGGINWWLASGSASGSASGESHYSYSGTGSYTSSVGSYSSSGGGSYINGTLNESGHDDSNYSASDTGSVSGSGSSAAWTWTGSDTVTASGSSHYDYSGSGRYSTSGTGWSASGSLSQSGRIDSAYSSTEYYSLSSNGATWTQTGGSASGSGSGEAHSSYSGGGKYSQTGTGWSASGTLHQSGHADSSYSGSWSGSYAVASGTGVGSWTWSGSDTVTASASSHYDYNGTITNTISGAGWKGTGTANQHGNDDASASSTEYYSLSSNGLIWSQTGGSASGSGNGEAHSDYNLRNGTYSSSSGSGSTGLSWSVSGVAHQRDSFDSSYNYSYSGSYGIASGTGIGSWTWSGSDTVIDSAGIHADANGKGTYTYRDSDKSGSGTMKVSRGDDAWIGVVTTYSLDPSGATWSVVNGSSSGDGGSGYRHESMNGGGTYLGNKTGIYHENSHRDSAYSWIATANCDASGNVTISGSKTTTASSGDHFDYNYSSPYTISGFFRHGSGTQNWNGSADDSASTTEHFSYSASGSAGLPTSGSGAGWTLTSGSSSCSAGSKSNYSYSVSGTVNLLRTSGSFHESGHNNTSCSSSASGSTSGGAWTWSGSQTQTVSSGTHYDCNGTGPYGVNGTLTSEADEDTSYSSTAHSALSSNGGAWIPQDSVATTTDNGHTKSAYNESGIYGAQANGGFLLGTAEDGGADTASHKINTTVTVSSSGAKTETGTNTSTTKHSTYSDYEGDGDYVHGFPGGAASGSQHQDGNTDDSYKQVTTSQDSNGTWSTPTTTGTAKHDNEMYFSYSGSGAFGYSRCSSKGQESGYTDNITKYSITQSSDSTGQLAVDGGSETITNSSGMSNSFSGSGADQSGSENERGSYSHDDYDDEISDYTSGTVVKPVFSPVMSDDNTVDTAIYHDDSVTGPPQSQGVGNYSYSQVLNCNSGDFGQGSVTWDDYSGNGMIDSYSAELADGQVMESSEAVSQWNMPDGGQNTQCTKSVDYQAYPPSTSTSGPTYSYSSYYGFASGMAAPSDWDPFNSPPTPGPTADTGVTASGNSPAAASASASSAPSSPNVASSTDADGNTTRFSYDANGNLASLTDPDGNTTSWTYDGSNRVTSETDALGDTQHYAYDADGNLVRYTDANGQIRQYQYDQNGRVTSETWYANATDAANGQNPEDTIVYEYDSAGRITSESDDVSSDTYQYDSQGNLISTTESSVDGPTTVLTYQYDSAGRRTEMATTIDGVADLVDDYSYDSLGRVVSVEEHGVSGGDAVAEKEIDIVYNDDNTIAEINRYQDGQLVVTGDYSYDDYGNLIGLVYHQGTTVLSSYSWTYDGSGQSPAPSPQSLAPWSPTGGVMPIDNTSGIVAAITQGGVSNLAQLTSCTSSDGTANYSYDPTGQLLGATYTGGQSSESYSYDANGNRTNAGYVIGADNRLLSDGTYTYTYNADGNCTAKFIDANHDGILDAGDTDITQYKWDARDRMTEVRQYSDYTSFTGNAPTEVVDYIYDVENRWIGEKIDSNGDGVIDHQIRFAYDGDQIIFQFDKDGGGQVTVNDLSHRYLWQPGAVDKLMADEQLQALAGGGYDRTHAGNVVWPLADQQGTIRDLAVHDAQTHATAVANHLTYNSYGKLAMQTNAAVNCLFGFTGRPLDKISGLQNNLNRWYDAKVGGWISKDPIGYSSCSTNAYCYCHNSPAMSVDSTGLWWSWTQWMGLVKAFSGAFEVLSGLVAIPATFGFSLLVSAHGADVMLAGLLQILDDKETDTYTSYYLQKWFGLSQNTANLVDATISIVGSMGTSMFVAASKAGGFVNLFKGFRAVVLCDEADAALPGVSKTLFGYLGLDGVSGADKLDKIAMYRWMGIIPQGTIMGQCLKSISLWPTGPTKLVNLAIGALGSLSGPVRIIEGSVPKS